MQLSDGSKNLMRLMAGERVAKPPFWEPWFGMVEMLERRWGGSGIQERIRMSQDLGMAIVNLGVVDTNMRFNETGITSDGVSRYCGGVLNTIEQMEERELPDWDEQIPLLQHDQGLVRDSGLVSWMILPWCFHRVATSMGLTKFAVRVYRDFPFVDRAFEIIEERNRLAIDRVIREVRPDIVLFDGDCSYKHGLMVDPGMFRRLVFEKTRETVSHLKKIGIPYVLHTDGKLDDVIPLLVELGFSMVHGCESNANDLGDLVNRFGDDIVLAGNMDIGFLSRATIPDVRRETLSMLETGSQKCKFVAACNTSPMNFIPDENYLAMAETIGDYPGRQNCPG